MSRILIPLLALFLAACGGDASAREPLPPAANAETDAAAAETRSAAAVVDSALPMDEALRRFQAATEGPVPAALSGGGESLEALFRALVRAYEARDAGALDALAVSRAEFAYLYYPESPYPAEPYQLSADFLWYLVEQRGTRGARRGAETLGGSGAVYTGHDCPGGAKEEGSNRLWGPCFVTVRFENGTEEAFRLANAVVEREGRFKLVGFDNKL